MPESANLRRADVFSGGLITVLGAAVLFAASRMPIGGTYGGVENPWYASPAALPLFLGVLFVLCGLALAAAGWRRGGGKGMGAALRDCCGDRTRRARGLRIAGVWGLLAVYVGSLEAKPFGFLARFWERLGAGDGAWMFLAEANGANYWAASAMMLTVFVFRFRDAARPASRFGWAVLLLALWLAPLVVAYVFARHLSVPLP